MQERAWGGVIGTAGRPWGARAAKSDGSGTDGPVWLPMMPESTMDPAGTLPIARIAMTALVAGILGGFSMVGIMKLITRADWARYDMIVAVGSMVTRTRENAFRTGTVIHIISGAAFALLTVEVKVTD